MRQLDEIAGERDTTATVLELTSAFEGIASMHISQIKDQVLSSQAFFGELWNIYRQIRVDENFHFGRQRNANPIKKELIILVTAEGSFSGDIDQRVVDEVAKNYDSQKNDVAVVGTHGASLAVGMGIRYSRSFRLPISDMAINVAPLVALVGQYASTKVYYPAYISLTHQEVKSIQMNVLVAERGQNVPIGKDEITEHNYIFEPSTHAVVDHLERSMTSIMLGEIILESKLAQYASRFQAMHSARDKAEDMYHNLTLAYNRAQRRQKDERSKEVINGLRKARL